MIVLYLVLIVLAFFFLVVRPQRRQLTAHRALVASLVAGDEVITSGGIYGTIRALDDQTVDLEVADGVVVRLARNAVAQKVTPEPEMTPDDEPTRGGTSTSNGDQAAD